MSAPRPDYRRLSDGIAEEANLLVRALETVELDRPSPTCPGWTAGHLAEHLHQALAWGTMLVEVRAPQFIPPTGAAEGAGQGETDWTDAVNDLALGSPAQFGDEDGRDKLTAWLIDGAERFVAALRDSGPHAPVWTTFGPHETAFWARWGAMEVAVHRADVELLAGREFQLSADLSYDAVDFWLAALSDPATVPFYDPKVTNLRGAGETLLFRATDAPPDAPSAWLVTRTPDGPRAETDPVATAGSADVVVTGGCADLVLLLKRRLPATDPAITVTGESALLTHWLANALT
ncbi:maleylpyruvate isomerase N-terminal domain-containing protein [Kitasatospora sp. NPDC101801]|uniref:maleylpyruvate isomerase N-terminal domain-containing protein n=1 Tax=Kitasatospora sp. NPDC101801 TaxID=3364103 RepID=UPI00381B0609